MQIRALTASEERGLTSDQKSYLLAHPLIVSLQPHILAAEALYNTPSHGAVTVERAMELDEIHASYRARVAHEPEFKPSFDSYSAAEDRFIELHGMSSSLH